MTGILGFLRGCVRIVARGNRAYYAWLGALAIAILVGLFAYAHQFRTGLIATNMRDQVSWAFYVGNFTFLVGVAAAAVLLVIRPTSTSGGPSRRSSSWASCSPSAPSPCASSSSWWTWAARTGSSISCRCSAPPTGRAPC